MTIVHTSGRMQPYAVWNRDRIWYFCGTLEEAEEYVRKNQRRA